VTLTPEDARQMLGAASDGFSAGEWCEAANVLGAALEAAEARAKKLQEDSEAWWEVEAALHDYWFAQEAMTAGKAVTKLIVEKKKAEADAERLAIGLREVPVHRRTQQAEAALRAHEEGK
jgi:hypothetical protein